MKRYKSCKECPKYNKCVMTADLRRKRIGCKYAVHPKQAKGGVGKNNEKKREEIYEILIDVMTHQNNACDTKCFVCEYSDRGCCGKIVDAMAKRLCDAGYRLTEKGGVE